MRCRMMLRHFARPVAALGALSASLALALADPSAAPDLSASQAEESALDLAPLSPEAQALRDALNFDPARATTMMPASPLRAPSHGAAGHDLDWNRTDKADGSAAVSVKKPLPFAWSANVDAKVGADFGFAAAPSTGYQPYNPMPSKDQGLSAGGLGAGGLGAAWANVTVPGIASIDARVDPAKEQSKLGTTFSRSLPFGSTYSLTLQNTFALTETLGSTPAPATIPGTTAAAPAQVWSNDRLVKFSILSTGTTLAAGTFSSTANNVTHNKISAEQKLFGPLSVTTAVTDVGAPTSSKSISAGFKLKW